ncbi:hypothetical protein Hanom_Chr01g00039061 [Helianthus anomalus]
MSPAKVYVASCRRYCVFFCHHQRMGEGEKVTVVDVGVKGGCEVGLIGGHGGSEEGVEDFSSLINLSF